MCKEKRVEELCFTMLITVVISVGKVWGFVGGFALLFSILLLFLKLSIYFYNAETISEHHLKEGVTGLFLFNLSCVSFLFAVHTICAKRSNARYCHGCIHAVTQGQEASRTCCGHRIKPGSFWSRTGASPTSIVYSTEAYTYISKETHTRAKNRCSRKSAGISSFYDFSNAACRPSLLPRADVPPPLHKVDILVPICIATIRHHQVA